MSSQKQTQNIFNRSQLQSALKTFTVLQLNIIHMKKLF